MEEPARILRGHEADDSVVCGLVSRLSADTVGIKIIKATEKDQFDLSRLLFLYNGVSTSK